MKDNQTNEKLVDLETNLFLLADELKNKTQNIIQV